jgi:cell division inhibitor SulA
MPPATPESTRSALLERLTASGAIWRGTSGAGLRAEPSGIAALDTRLPGGGWPAGALSELLIPAHGIGELSLALPLLARLTQAGRHAAFVAPPHIPYAPALARAGVALERTLVVEPKTADETIWATEQLLRTAAYGAVLAWTGALREADQRRLQLAAETGNGLALLYRPIRAAVAASVAALRLRLSRDEDRLAIEILKVRGGRPGARFYTDETPLDPLSPDTGERARERGHLQIPSPPPFSRKREKGEFFDGAA